MGVAMSVMEYPKWDGLALVSASGMDGPASDAVGSVSWVRRSSSVAGLSMTARSPGVTTWHTHGR